jgi:hypothetical protein
MRNRTIVVTTLVAVALITPATHNVGVEVEIKPKTPKVAPTKATMEQKKANKIMAMRFAQVGWGWDKKERACVYKIFMKESRFDHLAKNQQGSSAYGIAQMLGEKSKDPAVQILRAYRYIQHRYKTPCNAWLHHTKGWY